MGMPLLRSEYTREDYSDRDLPGLIEDRRAFLNRLQYWYNEERARGADARPHVLAQRRRELQRYLQYVK